MRHLLVFVGVVGLLAGAYFWSQTRSVPVDGQVVLHDVDGREAAASGAKAAWYPAEIVEQQLVAWISAYEDWQRTNELQLRAARNEWNQKTAARDEAARILRVAERANAADLAICQARHREAAADAEDALRRLEQLNSGADESADPARFVAGLPPASVEFAADADGRFSLQAPHGQAGYVVVSFERSGQRGESLVWLVKVDPKEIKELKFSNANVLTTESLAKLAREIKRRGTSEGPPAES